MLSGLFWLAYVPYCAAAQSLAGAVDTSKIQQVTIAVESDDYYSSEQRGFYQALSQAVFAPLNIPIHYRVSTFRQSLMSVNGGYADIVYGVSLIAGDKNFTKLKYNFSQLPVLDEEVWLLCNKYVPCTRQGFLAADSPRYAEIANYGYAKFFKLPYKIIHVLSVQHGVGLLKKHHVDYMLNDNSGKGLVSDEIFNTYNAILFSSIETHAGFTANERGRVLKQYFDERIKVLLLSGELADIYQRSKEEALGQLKLPVKAEQWLLGQQPDSRPAIDTPR